MATKKSASKSTRAKAPASRRAERASPKKDLHHRKKGASTSVKSKPAPVSKKPAAKAAPVKAAAAKAPPAKAPPAKAAPAKVVAIKAAASAPAAKPAAVKAAPSARPGKNIGPASPSSPAPVVAIGIHRNTMPRVPSADVEEGDADNAGLLAGPRNVQPYIAKRGEQYMNKVQLGHFSQILKNWKRDLMVEVDRTVSHMKDEAANFPDPNDRATQEEEFSLELRTRDRERKLIRKIDEALKRIDDGSYGYCLETGEEIGIKRLEARPVATLSIEAQERRERREKQYGDRDDRYR